MNETLDIMKEEPYHQKRVRQKFTDIIKYIEESENLVIAAPSEINYFEELLNSWVLYLPQLQKVVIKRGNWRNINNSCWYQSGDKKTLTIFRSPFEIIIKQNDVKVSSSFLVKDVILLLVEAIQKENRNINVYWD